MKKSLFGFGITILVGGVLTVIFTFFETQGYFRWHLLPIPPSQPSKLISGDFNNLIIHTDDGNLYICSNPFQDGCWIPIDASEIPELDLGHNSCPSPMNEINPLFVPFVIKQKLEVNYCWIEGNTFKIFALSNKGELWEWGSISTGISTIFMIIFGWIGTFLLAVIVALMIFVYDKEIYRKRHR